MNYVIFTSLILISTLMSGCSAKRYVPPVVEIVPAPVEWPVMQVEPQEIAIAKVQIPVNRRVIEKIVVMLDAGHGGEDFGTHSLGTPKYQEKYLNLSTTMMVKNFLQQFGYEVMLTRSDDTFISLDKRSMYANEQKPRLFVSIHFNSAPSADAEGIEVFYYKNEDNKPRMAKSKALAQAILDKTLLNTQAKSRGVKQGNYSVIRETNMPAVLIEGGFLTSTAEMEKIKNASYLKSLALGIAQGIQTYLAKDGILAER
ncbi:MAG TPA: N-acetylmuramoyl-L-alanine amidase [Parachlamydiaceae bacterium]|nr:N-acetylmuramoyl-L-alanine amidase [Parachlamydiaceae bacterium]